MGQYFDAAGALLQEGKIAEVSTPDGARKGMIILIDSGEVTIVCKSTEGDQKPEYFTARHNKVRQVE